MRVSWITFVRPSEANLSPQSGQFVPSVGPEWPTSTILSTILRLVTATTLIVAVFFARSILVVPASRPVLLLRPPRVRGLPVLLSSLLPSARASYGLPASPRRQRAPRPSSRAPFNPAPHFCGFRPRSSRPGRGLFAPPFGPAAFPGLRGGSGFASAPWARRRCLAGSAWPGRGR